MTSGSLCFTHSANGLVYAWKLEFAFPSLDPSEDGRDSDDKLGEYAW